MTFNDWLACLSRRLRNGSYGNAKRRKSRLSSAAQIEQLESRIQLSSGPISEGPASRIYLKPTGTGLGPPVVASDSAGDYVVAWGTSKDNGTTISSSAMFQRFQASGVPQGSTVTIASSTTITSFVGDPAVATDNTGDFVVVWIANLPNLTVQAQRYNSSGVAVGARLAVSAPTMHLVNPLVAMDSAGDFAVAYSNSSTNAVIIRRYNSTGVIQGPDINLSLQSPSLAMGNAGNFVVTGIDSHQNVTAQRYSLTGALQGTAITVYAPASTTAAPISPRVAMDHLGDFVVDWQTSPTTSAASVFARRFNSTGIPTGNVIPVTTTAFLDTTPTGPAIVPITSDATGDFALVWQSSTQGQGFVQVYSAAGKQLGFPTPLDPQVLVNMSVSMDSTGDFVVSGLGYQNGPDAYGVYTQRFLAASALNHAPVGTTTTVTTLEDKTYIFHTSDFGFSDPNDSPPNQLLAVNISTLPVVGALTVNGLAVTAGTTVPAADISSGKLKFTPVANKNGNTYASFTFHVQDDGGTQGGGSDTDPTARAMTINVTSVNDVPVGTPKTVTTLEDKAYVFQVSDFGFNDPNDSPPNSLLDVKIVTLPSVGMLTVSSASVTAGESISAGAITNGLLKFVPVTNKNGSAYGSFTFKVQDNGGTANGAIDTDSTARALTINVTSVNDAPVGTAKTVTTLEDKSYVFQLSDFGFSDPNDTSANSMVDVKITTLPTAGSLTAGGAAVTAGEHISTGAITNGLLKFVPVANKNGTAYSSFTFQVQDNGGTANGGVDTDTTARKLTINVTAVNDAPVGTAHVVSMAKNSSYQFTTTDFGFTDPNDSSPNGFLAVRITTIPTVGSLTDNGTAVTAGTTIAVADITNGKLKFTPATNGTGTAYASFTFQVQDNGGTANGGVDTDLTPRKMTISVT